MVPSLQCFSLDGHLFTMAINCHAVVNMSCHLSANASSSTLRLIGNLVKLYVVVMTENVCIAGMLCEGVEGAGRNSLEYLLAAWQTCTKY